MQKSLKVRAYSIYVTLFILSTTLAQAAPRRIDPDNPVRIWDSIYRLLSNFRRAWDTIQIPIG